MAVRLESITAIWTSWTHPTLTTGASIVALSSESRLLWGEPESAGNGSYIGVRGMVPPLRVVSEGTTFRLVRIRYVNGDVVADPGEELLTTAVGEVSIQFQDDVSATDIEITLEHTTGDDSDSFTLSGGFPAEWTVGDRVIEVIGFEVPGEGILSSIEAAKSDSVEAYLVGTLVDEAAAEPSGPAAFAPDRCEVPYVPPILDLPLIEDCDIPEDIQPIIDCPEIDLPSIAAIGTTIISGEPGPEGPAGPQGEPGDPGAPGCDPVITFSSIMYCIYHGAPYVEILRIPINDCWTHFHFIFYIPCAGYGGAGCTMWVWCPCDSDTYTIPPHDNNCPKIDTCTAAPGWWVALGSDSSGDAPCITGSYYGQTETVCDCPGSSSSSSSTPAEPPGEGCDCLEELADVGTLYLNIDSNCLAMNCVNLPLTGGLGLGCWTATNGPFIFSFCCMEDDEYRLYGVGPGGASTCSFNLSNPPSACDPFAWEESGEMVGGTETCCGTSDPDGTITATVTQEPVV
jgi:hypothetical protein